jgi:hypothetical protein
MSNFLTKKAKEAVELLEDAIKHFKEPGFKGDPVPTINCLIQTLEKCKEWEGYKPPQEFKILKDKIDALNNKVYSLEEKLNKFLANRDTRSMIASKLG